MISVQPGRREKLPAEAHAGGSCREEHGGRDGIPRGHEPRDNHALVHPVDALAAVEREAQAAPADILDLAKAGNERIDHVNRLHEPDAFLHQHHCPVPPSRDGSPAKRGGATRGAEVSTVAARQPFGAVNENRAIGSIAAAGEGAAQVHYERVSLRQRHGGAHHDPAFGDFAFDGLKIDPTDNPDQLVADFDGHAFDQVAGHRNRLGHARLRHSPRHHDWPADITDTLWMIAGMLCVAFWLACLVLLGGAA